MQWTRIDDLTRTMDDTAFATAMANVQQVRRIRAEAQQEFEQMNAATRGVLSRHACNEARLRSMTRWQRRFEELILSGVGDHSAVKICAAEGLSLRDRW